MFIPAMTRSQTATFLALSLLAVTGCPTPTPTDMEAPTVVRTVPDRDAVGVATNAKISIEFSEKLDPASVNADSVQLLSGTNGVSAAVIYDEGTNKAELAPAAMLSENREYTVSVSTTVSDLAGNTLKAPYTWKFTTVGNAPNVVSTAPADQAMNVPRDSQVRFTFDKPIDQASLTGNLTLVDGAMAAVPATVAWSDATLTATITPTNGLAEGGMYIATAKAAIKGTNGFNLPADRVVSFTVVNDAPAVLSTVPADMAMSVALDTALSARFSEAIEASTLTGNTFFLREGANMIAATPMLDAAGTTATLTPGAPLLEGRTYTVTLTTEVKDRFMNPLAAAKTWSFTTLATVPAITSILPANNMTGVSGNAPVRVTFSEAMDPATLTAASFQVMAGAVAVPGTRVWDAPSRTVTFQPTGAFPGGATITVRLTTAVKDPSGIGIASDYVSSFTVSNAPSVSMSSPAPNDTGVPLGAAVTLTFSTAMDVASLTNANVWVENAMGAKLAAAYTPGATSLTMQPMAMFIESRVYTVVVSTAVRSATNVPFAAEYRYAFTTSGIPPQISAVTPANDAADVSVSSAVTVLFDEDMDTATFTAMGFQLSDGANDVPGAITAMGNRTLVFTPAAKLREQHRFTVRVTSAVTDAAGNALAAPAVSHFTTEALPRLVSVSPVNGATGVALDAKIVLKLSEDIASMIRVTGVGATMTEAVTITNAAGARVDGAVTYSSATHTAVIRPQSAGADISWQANARYTLQLDGSKFLDANNNAVEGSWVLSFVTGSATDSTPPALVTSDPTNGATGISRSATIWAQLSEQISPASVSASTVRVLDGAAQLPGSVAYDPATRRVSFTPAGLMPASRALSFEIGAVADLSGNAKAATNTIGFTTADNLAPGIASSVPADGAMNVPVNSAVRIAFTEGIDDRTLSITSSAGPGTVVYDPASASALFVPNANFTGGAVVTLTIAPGLEDDEGSATAAPLTLAFTAVANSSQDVTAPAVQSIIPADAAMGVAALQPVTITFSEPMRPATLNASSYTFRERMGPNVLHRASFSPAGDQLVLTPLDALKGGVTYEVVLDTGMQDLAGNALASVTRSFTVESARPTVSTTGPASGSTVGSGVQVSVVFSEALDPSSIGPSTFGVTLASSPVLGAISYDAASRTAVFQPSRPLADGMHTVTLQAASIKDLAGNALTPSSGMIYSFNFTVSSAGPSVSMATPCGTQVDVDDLGATTVTVRFDRNVRRAGGAALDGSALKLQLMGADQAVMVAHTADTDTATLTPSAPLQAGQTYSVVATTVVLASNTNAPMASQYSCTFTTQRVVFQDGVNDTVTAGYTLTGSNGGNLWQRVNSGDDQRSSIVWRGGSMSDTQNYSRECTSGLQGAAQDRVITLEKQVDLTGYTQAEARFFAMDDVQRMGAADEGRFIVNDGTDHVIKVYTGQNAANPYVREGKGSGNLTPYVNRTVRLKWQLVIRGHSAGLTGNCNNAPAGRKGLFVDDIVVVGQ